MTSFVADPLSRTPGRDAARVEDVISLPVGKQKQQHPQQEKKTALVIEDMREACIELRLHVYTCDRITHNELMASTGQEYTGNLIKGDYNLLWIATPSDWYVRTPDKRANPHWQRIQTWLRTATKLGMQVVMFGPPGFQWKIPSINETIEDLSLHTTRMRLCHFGEQFNKQDSKPSGSYIQVVTNMPIKYKLWACRCNIPIVQHSLDWYGKTLEHVEWRTSVKRRL